MGACFPGQGRVVLRGLDLFHDLKGISWTGLLFFAVTGRIPDQNQVLLFEGIWSICTSYPDPRLWNNRVAALAGTARSTASLAVTAANAVSEATIYGHRPIIRSIDFLHRIQREVTDGKALSDVLQEALKKYRTLPGYGRPLARTDERIEPIMALARQLGFADGPYVKLAFSVEDILLTKRWRLRMNIAALLAGLAADQGLSASEYHHLMIFSFSGGILPCFIDASTQPEGLFFPLHCDSIRYSGNAPRTWHEPRNGQAVKV